MWQFLSLSLFPSSLDRQGHLLPSFFCSQNIPDCFIVARLNRVTISGAPCHLKRVETEASEQFSVALALGRPSPVQYTERGREERRRDS